ncbi:MAG: segregation/condensation protein A [Deltaproteobacteria bacterium]
MRTPVGIPRDYKPTDTSIHDLFRVELSEFAGPLDLLLYLIRKHELDIFDIPIAFITDRYVAMIDALQALEVDVAADFLVMAAELTHIKSKMLLPVKEGVAVEDEEEEGDPREELVRRLLEYQKYRDAAHQLADRDRLGRDVFARNPPTIELVDELDPGLKSVSIFKLVELMAKLLRRAPPAHHEISFESVSIAERIHYVMAFGEAREGKFTLVQLLDGILARAELIVTFIAVLEMTKLGLIKILMEDLPSWRASSLPKKADVDEDEEDEPLPVPPAVEDEDDAPAVEDDAPPDDASPDDAAADDTPEDEPPPAVEDHADEGSAAAARRLAHELDAAAPELEALSDISAAPPATPKATTPWEDEPLPEIWIHFTGKRFEGDILDDYQ